MRIISLNANGIRAAARKGFFTWLSRQRADLCCIQETKAQVDQLTDTVFHPTNHHTYYVDAVKKGYSGVAMYSRHEPTKVIRTLREATDGNAGWDEFDAEGRYIELQFGDLSVVSLYLPSGSSKEERQLAKFRFLDLFMPFLEKAKKRKRQYIICGDWNIAHKKIDIKNWRSNQKNSGFLPEERAWMDQLIHTHGYVDTFREVNDKPDQYTWWSNRGNARANNVGWRIDYQIASPKLAGKTTKTRVYTDKPFSDHAPLITDYDLTLG
ncbi:MAG: exodeoxyribonuclease III [Gammaproteobacteria bacterium]